VLQTDFSGEDPPVSAGHHIDTFFINFYSGTPLELRRVAFSSCYAAIEMLTKIKLAEEPNLPLVIVFDLVENTTLVGIAKPDGPLLQKGKYGKIEGMGSPGTPLISLEVLEELTKLIKVANNHKKSTVVSEESLLKEATTEAS